MSIDVNSLGKEAREQIERKYGSTVRTWRSEPLPPRKKMGNKQVYRTGLDGKMTKFDSIREADRFAELQLLERQGQISNLRTQVPYELIPMQRKSNGKAERSCVYYADFVYTKNGKTVVEDSKGYRDTASAAYAKFVIKRKLMLYKYGIEIQEV